MTASLEIRLLGPFDVLVAGRPVVVSGTKRQALLALLALQPGRVVSVDALIDALWGPDLPASPRNAVQHHVARLRAALGHEAIAASGEGYAVPEAEVDAVRFEQLLAGTRAALRGGDLRAAETAVCAAIGLWRGEALLGLTGPSWFATEASRLEALRVDAVEEQFEVRLALGEHRELAPAIRAQLEREPFRERLWGQLMLALYRSGRQADALEVFQEARQVLSEQLGLEPGPDLRRLQDAILAHDPAVAAASRAPERRGNLPASSTSFVGREREVARVVELLGQHRLVTLTGPPGVGKTRLALEALRVVEREVPDGVWHVDLERAAEPADVVRLVASVIDARGPDSLDDVTAGLRDARALVCLDSCEQVLEEAARVASTLLAGAPGVRVLATSREILRVAGEVRFSIPPLPVDDGDLLAQSAAVELFEVRAAAARPDFDLTPDTVAAVGEIVRLLDGLPLAIELTAARVNVMGLVELRSLVESRLTVLERPGAPAEVRAAGTLVAWSYDLLHADEKALLQGIAVHRGGCSLASVTAVVQDRALDQPMVAYLLGGLVDKSIVSASFPVDAARYTVLETVRDYALGRLAEEGDPAGLRRAHAAYFAALAESSRSGLRDRDWREWRRQLDLETDNMWAALAFARDVGDAQLAAELAAPRVLYFALAGRVSEGRRFLDAARAVQGGQVDTGLLAELLGGLCYLATEELDLDAAVAAGEAGLEIASAGAAPEQLALVQLMLGQARAICGEVEEGTALIVAARKRYLAAGDDWGVSVSSLILAIRAAAAGDAATVAAMTPDVIRSSEAISYDAFHAPAILLEAWLARRRGDLAAEAEAYRRALKLAPEVGLDDHGAFALAQLGAAALGDGETRAASQLLRQAIGAAEAAGSGWVAAYAQAQLGHALAAEGDGEAAEQLYRTVLDWSQTPRQHTVRESLVIAIAGDPATAALLGLADLADDRGDTTVADEYRARAGAVLT